MWRNSFSYNFIKTWTHPKAVFKGFAYFLKKHLSVGASGNKKKYNELKKQHKPNKNRKYKIQYTFFEEFLKTSVLS